MTIYKMIPSRRHADETASERSHRRGSLLPQKIADDPGMSYLDGSMYRISERVLGVRHSAAPYSTSSPSGAARSARAAGKVPSLKKARRARAFFFLLNDRSSASEVHAAHSAHPSA